MTNGSPSAAFQIATLAERFAGHKVVVTGGLGFIGSNLAVALADNGAEVVVVDSLVPKHGGDRSNIDTNDRPISVRIADIGDSSVVTSALDGAQYIFSLAGQVSHVDSMEDPLKDLDINARAQIAFLELARVVSPSATIVHSSTRQVYGRPNYNPVDESHPTVPTDINGINKLAGEQYHLLYAQIYNMKISALRITNVYGPRQRLRGSDQGFIPIFLRHAFEDQPITLYGQGEQLRDCLYVADVVEALMLTALTPDAVGQVFNVGHSEPLSLASIADVIVGEVGSGMIVNVPWPKERSAIDIGSFVSDSSKIKEVCGWQATTSFAQGVRETVGFYRNRLGVYL